MEEISREDIILYMEKSKKYLQSHFFIDKIGLFGSFARGEGSLTSDIDIIIELKNGTPNIYEIKEELREHFNKKFHRNIDIAREKYLKKYVRDDILKEVIYVK